jgi:hypothetical protein
METEDNVLNNSLVFYLGDYIPITEESIELGEYNKFLTVLYREGMGGDRNIHLSYKDKK